ncbi:hypothetical protein ACHAWF_010619 [Thalassiosira exigua]
MKTAASFAKGMLELEGDIPPILVSLVHKEKDSRHMAAGHPRYNLSDSQFLLQLDPSGNKEVKNDLDKCKEQINANMNRDVDYSAMTVEECESLAGPGLARNWHEFNLLLICAIYPSLPIHTAFCLTNCRILGRPWSPFTQRLASLWCNLTKCLESSCLETKRSGLKAKEGHETLSSIKLYKGETLLVLTERWKLLQNKLYDDESNTDTVDLSRVPDVHDNVRFDMLHNPHLGLTETLQKLYGRNQWQIASSRKNTG